MDIGTVTLPIGQWTPILKPQVRISTVAILVFVCDNIQMRVELTLMLAASLVNTLHLESMVNCYNANAIFCWLKTRLKTIKRKCTNLTPQMACQLAKPNIEQDSFQVTKMLPLTFMNLKNTDVVAATSILCQSGITPLLSLQQFVNHNVARP